MQTRVKLPKDITISDEGIYVLKDILLKKCVFFSNLSSAEKEGQVKERFPVKFRDGRIILKQ